MLEVGDVELASLSGLAFGPTADPTDEPSSESLYVADSGGESTLGRVAEVSLTALGRVRWRRRRRRRRRWCGVRCSRSCLRRLGPGQGIVYMSDEDRLLVADSEVEEMAIYQRRTCGRSRGTGRRCTTPGTRWPAPRSRRGGV